MSDEVPMSHEGDKPLILVIDGHEWIGKVDEHLANTPECLSGIVMSSDMVVSDAFKAALVKMDDRYDYIHFDAMDYVFSAIDEVNPNLIIDDFVYEQIHGWLNEAMEMVMHYVRPVARMVCDSEKYKNAGYWNLYRVSNSRFFIEVGDGSRTLDQYYFGQGPFLRKNGTLEDSWLTK